MIHKKVSLIIPCLNEEGNIEAIFEKIHTLLHPKINFEVIFVDDGSTDNTLDRIKSLFQTHSNVYYVSFSRNFGHQSALKAGFEFAQGDCAISMDADLQHPPEILIQLIDKWLSGYDIVYTKRIKDKESGYFKQFTSKLFYRLMNYISEVNMDEGVADFRLLDRKVVNIFKHDINEYSLFYRGLVSWVGFKQTCLTYEAQKRFQGHTKYRFINMLNFALDGITSFSIRPLRIALAFGVLVSFFVILYIFFVIGVVTLTDKEAPGWASVIVSVLFVGSIQLIFIGILGEYLGKMFLESKQRPHFLIQETNCLHHE